MTKVVRLGGWVFYLGEEYEGLNPRKCGKWMYFFANRDRAAELCKAAVDEGVVAESKHSDAPNGVCCFYLNGDDMLAHRRVIEFFLENDMIRRTKAGRLYNISFKYDDQTRAGEYGDAYEGQIKLAQLIDLKTGEWIG